MQCRTWFLAVLLFSAAGRDALGKSKKERWTFRPAYTAVHFRVKHLLITTVRGFFGQVEGEVLLDTDDITRSSVNATVYIKSLNTADARRDKLLRGSDFFNLSAFPFATFSSKRVEQDSDDNLLVTGELTMHGVTREVTLEVEGPTPTVKDPSGIPTRAIDAKLRLDRKDYGMAWNRALDGGGVEVGDEVLIEIDAELEPPPPPALPVAAPALPPAKASGKEVPAPVPSPAKPVGKEPAAAPPPAGSKP